jgi:mRNA interferase MazF
MLPIPRRGEIWQVDLGLVAKVRPAVILSVPFLDHERALFEIVPHTTSLRGTRFELAVTVTGLQSGAFDAQGLRNVPRSVLLRKLGTLTPDQLASLERAVKLWLGFESQ